jgi:hypothetical protein
LATLIGKYFNENFQYKMSSEYVTCYYADMVRFICKTGCCVELSVLMAVAMKREVCWNVTPCSLERADFFGWTYCLHLQGCRINQARNQQKQVAAWAWLTVQLQRWRLYVALKHLGLYKLHRTTLQKTVLLTDRVCFCIFYIAMNEITSERFGIMKVSQYYDYVMDHLWHFIYGWIVFNMIVTGNACD